MWARGDFGRYGMAVRLAIVGAGMRGTTYAREAVRAGAAVVAVAEPDPRRRTDAVAEFGVPAGGAYAGWRDLAAAPGGRGAGPGVIATQDRMHAEPAIAFAGQGYDILLEKPLAPAEEDATAIVAAAEAAGVIFAVCHVMRYSPYTRRVKEIVDSGRLGRLASVQHL